jgi:adenosylmethionine-8-amino-7-oxononanoate aminotransferase
LLIPTGSEGNEAVYKATVQDHTKEKRNPEPDRTLFIARERSYHGATLGALGLSGHLTRREIFKPVLPINTSFISACNPYRDLKDGLTVEEYVHQLAEELENKILELGDKRVAGFIMEPVVGAVSYPKHNAVAHPSSTIMVPNLTQIGTWV